MQRISCKIAGLAIALVLVLVGHVQAQQQQHQQHHPGGAQASPPRPAGAGQGAAAQPQITDQMQDMMGQMQDMMGQMQGMMGGGGMQGRRSMMAQEEDDDEEASPQRRRMGRHGMMGRRRMMDRDGMIRHGGMIQHHLERLARHLELTAEQRMQMWTVLGNQAKDAIRLQADLETLAIDLQQQLEADPVDLAKVKPLLQTIAGKEADLRLLHIMAMQEMSKMLTPDQRQKLHTIRHSMMGHGGMRGHKPAIQ